MGLQLPEGEVAELPAHMQQALPDIQRQGYALDRHCAAIFQPDMDIAGV
ncbi:Uncharacterised protein [Klebsiella pneumoniae]|nr:Uncharacterised protein [Klebsiella pneumoniae]